MKTILLYLVPGLALYYSILYLFVFKGNWRAMFSIRRRSEKDIIITTTAKNFDEKKLLGKSNTTAIPVQQEIQPDEPIEIALDIPIEFKTEQEESSTIENLDNESIELEEQGFMELSTGATFEELQLVVDVVRNEDMAEESKIEAGAVISNIGKTDMFELLLQFSNGQQKVDNLLKKHIDNTAMVAGLSPDESSQLSLFEMGKYV